MRLNVTITTPRSTDPWTDTGPALLHRVVAAVRALEAAGTTAVVVGRATTVAGQGAAAVEPTTLAGALARRTGGIGIVAADSALFGHPYNTARRLASLDHLTRGRAGWAVEPTAGPGDEAAFGLAVGGPAEQAVRAGEYAEVVTALWGSWEPGAVVPDKTTGDFRDDSRIHPIAHRATYYRVQGPLDVPRCPQGRPVVVWPVRSARDVPPAARSADVAAPWCATAEEAVATCGALRDAAAAAGRDPEDLLVLPAVGRGPAPGAVAAPAAVGRWVAAVAALVEEAGADGITLVGDGSPEWADDVAAEVLPALRDASLLTAPPPGPTLAQRYGLPVARQSGRAA
jgi:alkanesulfonate monooxygenase SsuD/methylene tetrahydromethanopterin reductase-like flavin-dependent oxidoreductase (luciferase family)